MTQVPTGSSTALEEAVTNAAVAPARPGKTLQDEIRALTPQLAAGIPPGTLTPERFTRMILTEIRKTPKLLECTRESFLGAMMQVAQLGLEIGGTLGEAFLIPYWNNRLKTTECQLQIGYKGWIALAYRGGIIMESREVHENDGFDFDFAMEPPYHHTWKLGQPRGEIIGFYGTAKLPDGRVKLQVMSIEEINERRARAQSKDNGPWKTDFNAMARKTLIRALVPQTPMTTELSLAIKVDDATITRETSGDLLVRYQEPIDVKAIEAAGGSLQEDLTNVLNAIEPNASRLECGRHLLARFGPIHELSDAQLLEALDVAKGWPESAASAPEANARTGEIIETREVPRAESNELEEVLSGIPEPQQSDAREALAGRFGGTEPDPEAELAYLNEWLDAEPEEAPIASEPPSEAPAARTEQSGGSDGLSDAMLKRMKASIGTWSADVCKQKLQEWGHPASGSVDAMRARLLMVLGPEVAAGNEAASVLF